MGTSHLTYKRTEVARWTQGPPPDLTVAPPWPAGGVLGKRPGGRCQSHILPRGSVPQVLCEQRRLWGGHVAPMFDFGAAGRASPSPLLSVISGKWPAEAEGGGAAASQVGVNATAALLAPGKEAIRFSETRGHRQQRFRISCNPWEF